MEAKRKGIVLSAIQTVVELNGEAGASNESLNALLRAVSEEKGKPAFHKFFMDIMALVHRCFTHFSSVMPKLAKARTYRDFHQAVYSSCVAVIHICSWSHSISK